MSKATRRFIVNKILEMLITLVVVTLISFLLVRLSPIDPAEAYARRSSAAFSFTDEQMEALREDMGLNDPLPVQYVTWVWDALHLDFGESFVSGQPVFEKVTTAIGITVTIVLISAVIQAVFILLFGCLCYLTRKRMIGRALIFLCIAGVSIPSFFFASSYLDIFAVKLGLTSVVGNTGLMRYLPAAVCIAIGCIALFSPMLANNIQKEMEQDSAFYARCRGLSEGKILLRYALPSAVVTLLPSFCQMLGLCMAGSAREWMRIVQNRHRMRIVRYFPSDGAHFCSDFEQTGAIDHPFSSPTIGKIFRQSLEISWNVCKYNAF